MKSEVSVLILLLFFTLNSQAQQLPLFSVEPLKISIPANLPGIMEDPMAELKNDTLVYITKGQVFTPAIKIPSFKKHIGLNSPWSLITELTEAYSKKDSRKIISLYEAGSEAKITGLLTGEQSLAFLQFVSEVVHSNLRILGGIEYKDGFMVYTRDDKYGLHANYMIKEEGGYKLKALEDESSSAWNISLYFKFNPGPMIPVMNLILPDSIQMDGTMTVIAILPDAGRWVAAYFGKPGEPVKMLVQDNGASDLDPQKKVVRFRLPASVFPGRGKYTFYISSFNYPVQKLTGGFFIPAAKHEIIIY